MLDQKPLTIKLSALAALSLILTITTLTPDTIHWRDSGEFQLVAHFQDIAHPAGFPSYAQLANLFALLPVGPISWRVNLFSSFVFCLWLFTVGQIAAKLSGSKVGWIAAVFAGLTAAASKSAFAAEVYGLHSLLCLLIFNCYLRWLTGKNIKELYFAAILAGFALGNHVAAILFLLPLALVISFRSLNFKETFSLAGVTIFLTLLLYLFLPLRTDHQLPLNTGQPDSPIKLYQQLINARERALKVSPSSAGSPSIFKQLTLDSIRLTNEIGYIPSALAVIGLLFLITSKQRQSLILVTLFCSTLLFFNGWDTDPWLPAFSVVAILAAFALAKIKLVLVLATVIVHVSLHPFLNNYLETSRDRTANKTIRALLESVPANGTLILEPSWFLARSATLLEGIRDDLTIIYTPSLLFPNFFNETNIKIDLQNKVTLKSQHSDDYQYSEAVVKNIGKFLGPVCSNSICQLEPSQVTAQTLKNVVSLTSDGRTQLIPGQGKFSDNFDKSVTERGLKIIKDGCYDCGSLKDDRQNYAESIVTSEAEVLLALGKLKESSRMLRTVCNESNCSKKALDNLKQLSELSKFQTISSSQEPLESSH